MAIPFYENEEQSQHHQQSEEIDQVDGPVLNPPNIQSPNINPENLTSNTTQENQNYMPTAEDLMAWKILALAMCKALKDHYQQNMTNTSTPNTSETSTAVLEILPNGQVKPSWN